MHDTTLDGEFGESLDTRWTLKNNRNIQDFQLKKSKKDSGPAVEEFLENNDNWELEKKYENCNGLTILKRIKTV